MRLRNALATLLFALSCVEQIDARHILRIRQDITNVATSTNNAPTSSPTSDATPSPSPTSSASKTSDSDGSSKSTTTSDGTQSADVTSPITVTGQATQFPTSTATPVPASTNSTSASIKLPIQPAINPPLGIAGVILMISGLGLGFVGIKHRATQTLLSTALLVALGIEVLIIYLMQPPVPVAIQGAYLIAGVGGGALLGGLSLIFKEVCEGFGCVLGGFCFAMWLLVLTPGGTITNSAGKIILIAILSVAGYCSYISRFTRIYGIIFCTAFAGSTAFILGIDCFSKAGLKEFWLYIWNLNDNEFPLFTNTYPISRSMRAEIAAIVIVAFLAVMSQIKIWKIVKEQKAKRDAQRIRDEEARDALEEEVGREIEHRNRHSLEHWEEHYDNKKQTSVKIDSGLASVEDFGKDVNSSEIGSTRENRYNSFPLINVAPATRDGSSQQSQSSFSRVRTSLAPSLPPLSFKSEEEESEDTKPMLEADADTNRSAQDLTVVTSPRSASPGLSVPESSVKERRGINLKRLSLMSLRSRADESAKRPESPFVEEEDDDAASSVAATAAEAPDVDALSVRLSRPNSMYLSYRVGSPRLASRESFIEDDDEEALQFGQRNVMGSRASLRVPSSPGTPGHELGSRSPFNESSEQVELADHLPKKMSRAASKYRTNEWAKAVSSAEQEPMQELPEHDPEAVQIEMGDAAEAARAKENNASPAPPPPPPPPPPPVTETKRESKAERRSSSRPIIHRQSSTTLTPVYSHAHHPSDADSWTQPLGKRASSNPLVTADPPAPVDSPHNVSTPMLDEVKGEFPMEKLPSQKRMTSQQQIRRRSSSNLLDARRDRLENRLTTTSFMVAPRASVGNPPAISGESDKVDPFASRDSQEDDMTLSERKRSIATTATNEDDMTLAERKALVQQQQQPQATAMSTFYTTSPERGTPNALARASFAALSSVQPPAPIATTTGNAKSPNKLMRMSSQGPIQPLYDSHQPQRMSNHNASKQAANWSQWRNSNAVVGATRDPYLRSDDQLDMLRAVRSQSDSEAKQRELVRAAKQEQMDAHMRMGGMNGAHRAALARMQGEVNRNAL